MMYGTLYRNVLLPFFDGVIKGRETMRFWREAEAAQWLPRATLEARQVQSLQQLLKHAETTCPYFRKVWNEQGLAASQVQSLKDFTQFPVTTREQIRAYRTEMRTTKPMMLMSKGTGGSSGEPVHFDLDSGSNDRRTALMYRGYGWAGGAPGSRQLFVWGSHVGKVPLWKQWKAAIHHRLECHKMLSCFEFTPDKMRAHLVSWNQYRPAVIVAYTNPLYEFARFIEANSLSVWSPGSIIVGAEKLHSFQRETMERVFGTKVFETYGSREFMLMGAECEHHTGLHLSIDNLLIEILDEQGNPTPKGEEGNIVVTDLFNYGMPFIRYLNGDRAVAGFEDCPCGRGLPLLKTVTGRQLDTLTTPDGRSIPGEFFPHLLKEFPKIRRFQVVQQTVPEIELKLVASEAFNQEEEAYLLKEVRRGTGDIVHIRLNFVEDIPLTRAGKLKVVVNTVQAGTP